MMSFKNLLAKKSDRPVRLVGAWDGLSARLIEAAGFEGIWSSGFAISTSHGVPDCSVLGKESFLERSLEMRRATSIPILQDMDTGYGGPAHLRHHVRDFENAGINGVCIEDKIFPKSNSFVEGGQELMSIEDFCQKIISAKQAQRTSDFWVVARIEAFISGFGLSDAIYRADAYADCGADAILIHSKSKSGSDIAEFLAKWTKKCPIVIVPTTYDGAFTEFEMKEFGVDVVIYANQLIRAMVYYGMKILNQMKKFGIYDPIEVTNMTLMFELQNMPEFKRLEKKYAGLADNDNTGVHNQLSPLLCERGDS